MSKLFITNLPSGLKPNAHLERAYMSGKGSFGKRLSPVEKEVLRAEINFRNAEGIYVYTGRSEARKLRPIYLSLID
jgi:hypothetical protein